VAPAGWVVWRGGEMFLKPSMGVAQTVGSETEGGARAGLK